MSCDGRLIWVELSVLILCSISLVGNWVCYLLWVSVLLLVVVMVMLVDVL